jgi:hypothetical protein
MVYDRIFISYINLLAFLYSGGSFLFYEICFFCTTTLSRARWQELHSRSDELLLHPSWISKEFRSFSSAPGARLRKTTKCNLNQLVLLVILHDSMLSSQALISLLLVATA